MAVLQAARAAELGLSKSQAKSWGLNRAIFYAAAKRGFKHRAAVSHGQGELPKKRVEKSEKTYLLGNEVAYTSKKGNRVYFTIGGQAQTEADFKRQIQSRFGDGFDRVWTESLSIIREYPKEVLLSKNRFFSEVYRPRRDDLASKWTEMSEKGVS